MQDIITELTEQLAPTGFLYQVTHTDDDAGRRINVLVDKDKYSDEKNPLPRKYKGHFLVITMLPAPPVLVKN